MDGGEEEWRDYTLEDYTGDSAEYHVPPDSSLRYVQCVPCAAHKSVILLRTFPLSILFEDNIPSYFILYPLPHHSISNSSILHFPCD